MYDRLTLRVENLTVEYLSHTNALKAVDNVSFSITGGTIVGLIGESGSGKTTVGKAILRLLPNSARIVSGKVLFRDVNLLSLNDEEIRKIRGREITLIQQDPSSALNPAFKIEDQITDVLMVHKGLDKSRAKLVASGLLRRTGIFDPERIMQKFPHQISGGMAQRIAIAIAFACDPTLVIADEATSALDTITQASVVRLIKELSSSRNTSVLFITHDIALASKICDEILVMYHGKIVESGKTSDIVSRASHPYTRFLLSVVPSVKTNAKDGASLVRKPSDQTLPSSKAYEEDSNND
jgi:ABC-type dipeptide/oligopeptide/nickel transport system ATPase component